jgi:hypothetical protein
MSEAQGLLKGVWELGPATPAFRLRPSGGKWTWYEGARAADGLPVGFCLLRRPWLGNPGVRAAYRHGMELVGTLDHPNILKVYDVVDEEDAFGLVTEPLSGEDLHRLVTHSAAIFREAQVVRILGELAAALEHARERGVLFENLKPTNVQLAPDGSARIGALPRPPFRFTSFLDAAAHLSNVAYCAPELLRCQPLDQRTVVYGLGITAYEMICSRVPLQLSENLASDLEAIASAELPAPAELVEGLNPRLNEIVARCLRKDPAQRYGTAAEVLKDLRRVQGRPAPLIGQRRLLEIVTSGFPAPLAALARSLERDDHLLAQRDKLINQAGGLIGYLGFLAAGAGTRLEEKYRRPSLGDWVRLVRRALGDRGVGWPLAELLGSIPSVDDLLATLDEAVRLRNLVGHGAAPEEGTALHDWVARMTAAIRRLYAGLLGLARYALVAVEDLDYRDDGRFQLTIRRLEGVQAESQAIQVTRPEPCARGRVYFAAADFSRMVGLHPWVVLAKCPLCFQRELFFYVSAEGGEIRYVTPDRGHSWSCSAPPDFEKVFGGTG